MTRAQTSTPAALAPLAELTDNLAPTAAGPGQIIPAVPMDDATADRLAAAVDLASIEAARDRIAGHVLHTPFLHARTLSAITGAEIWVKFENQQFIASFKERGACNRLMQLAGEERARGVCAMSAGNHAQGVAYHAQRFGIAATIVMPRTTPFVKVEHTRAHGADVVLAGETLSEASDVARQITHERNLTFVHPYDDVDVIRGQGTVALEMLEDGPALDQVVVPIGGGGLMAGIATVMAALSPATEVIGVQSDTHPSMLAAVRGEPEPERGGATIAEGIAVKAAGRITRRIIKRTVRDILLVNDEAIERAIALFLNVEKTVAEGAGSAALACVLAHPERFRGKQVGLVLAGGNIDSRLLASVLMRELVREKRIVRLMIKTPDQPGSLARIVDAVANAGGNIIEVMHNRLSLTHLAKEVAVELLLEARDQAHAQIIIHALEQTGSRVETPHV